MLTTPTKLRALALAAATLAAGGGLTLTLGEDAKRSVDLKSGLRMAYREAGPAGAPPLILLHGLGDTSRSWSLMAPELSKHNRLYMLDQRGHGGTEAPACCYSLPVLAYDVIAFMDAMKVESAAIAGHSLGSFVGQYLVTAYPSRVRSLVLLGSADTTTGSEGVGWLWDQVQTFDSGVSAAFVDEWQANPTPVPPDFMAQVKSETAAVPLHVWKGVARALLTEDHSGFLARADTPTLILWGGKDPMFPEPFQERLRKLLPRAGFKAHPEVGHNLHWEIPGQIAAEIEAFLHPGAAPAAGKSGSR